MTRSSGPSSLTMSRMRIVGLAPRRVGDRVCGLHDLDTLAGLAVPVAGHDEPLERSAPVAFDGAGHVGGSLAGADDHRPPPGGRGQPARQQAGRIDRADRSVEHGAQEGSRLDPHKL